MTMPTLPNPEQPPPARVAPLLLPRWVQLVLLPLAVLGAVAIMRAAGPVLLLFIVAGLIALLLNPFVTLLRRVHFPRGLAVLSVMLCVVLLVVGIGVLLANPVADQVSAFQRNVPGIVDDANASLEDFQAWLDRNGIDLQVKEEGSTALQTLGGNLSEGSGELVSFTSDALQILVEASVALILVIVLCVYMLLYGERIGQGVRSLVPRGDGTPEDDFPTRIQAAVFGYVRGQLLFSLIMGTSAGVLLWVLGSLGMFPDGKTYAFFFGAFYGFAELIPYVGPAVGAFPPVMIALFSGEPLDAVWLIIAFTALQQIEGHIVAPTVFSQALRINPLLVIFALLLGGQLYGFLGAFIALPIAAILRETTVYLRRHVRLEPWDLPAVAPAGASFGGEPPRQGPTGSMPAAGYQGASESGQDERAPTMRQPRSRPVSRPSPARSRGAPSAARVASPVPRRAPSAEPSSATPTRPHPRRRRRRSSGNGGYGGPARGRGQQALRRPDGAAGGVLRGPARRARGRHRPQRRRQDDAAADRGGRARAVCRDRFARPRSRSVGCRSSPRSTRSSPSPRTCGCSRGSRRSPTCPGRWRGCSSRPVSRTAPTTSSGASPAATASA